MLRVSLKKIGDPEASSIFIGGKCCCCSLHWVGVNISITDLGILDVGRDVQDVIYLGTYTYVAVEVPAKSKWTWVQPSGVLAWVYQTSN